MCAVTVPRDESTTGQDLATEYKWCVASSHEAVRTSFQVFNADSESMLETETCRTRFRENDLIDPNLARSVPSSTPGSRRGSVASIDEILARFTLDSRSPSPHGSQASPAVAGGLQGDLVRRQREQERADQEAFEGHLRDAFQQPDPVWDPNHPDMGGQMQDVCIRDVDRRLLADFHREMDKNRPEHCRRCNKKWFNMDMRHEVCKTWRVKDVGVQAHQAHFFSDAKKMQFTPKPADLPELTQTEIIYIARYHTVTEVHQIRGGNYRYRGHVCCFPRDTASIYRELPLLPEQLPIIVLKDPPPQLAGRELQRFKIRRQAVSLWLDYLKHNHPLYRTILIDADRMSQLPEDGSVLHRLPNQMNMDASAELQ